MKRLTTVWLALLLALCMLFATGCIEELGSLGDLPGIGDLGLGGTGGNHTPIEPADPSELRNPGANPNPIDPSTLPAYSGDAYIAIRDNMPDFASNELVRASFEYYSPLDALGRCGYTVACIGKDLMPTEERGSIGSVKPSGWQTVKYDIVDGKYLYNRCHLIGFQLTGENANKSNLITGTRYLNIDGMLDFENMVADYIKETGNHVLYRVTPIFVGNELVARGVEIEAYSVEDGGDGICFHVYSYNVQPGITIDYANGNSVLSGEELPPPVLRTDVLDIDDLAPGMELTGTVRNVIDFGAFVDIGVHQDGLVHISRMSEKFIKHPSEAVAVGDVVFAGFPGEPFTEMGRAVKRASKFTLTIPACAANGYEGYYPTIDCFKESGYEVRSSRYVGGTAEKIVETSIEIINGL